MPAPRDLTGLRFGKLTVLRSDGRVKWGHDQSAWLCRCDCGAELRVPLRRLTTSHKPHQLHACEDCRAVPCAICGAPVALAAKAKTCSPECKAEYDRRYQIEYYHEVRTHDKEDTEKRRQRGRDRWSSMPPEKKLSISRARSASESRDAINERARLRHRTRMVHDPDYAAGKAAAREKFLATKDPEALREYQRSYAEKRRAQRTEIEMLQAIDRLTGDHDDQ